MQRVENWDYEFAPLSGAALPTVLFAEKQELQSNGTTLTRRYLGPSPTDSDIGVNFVEPDVLHTGNTFWNGFLAPSLGCLRGRSEDFESIACCWKDIVMGRLQDKVAVITGANSGIGLAAAKLFAAEGARVFMTARRKPELDAAVAEVGRNATGIQSDVSKLSDLDRLFAVVSDEAGKIDVLFANAGGGEFAALGNISEEHFDTIFATNVKGTLFTVQKALPLLKDGSSVILTGSTTGTTGTPAFSVYSASKAAVRNFARTWILDLAPRRIRVNVLVPGATSTPGWHNLATSDEAHRQMVGFVETMTPLGRLGDPDEVARAALFLASDDSSFVTGSELFADGGAAQV